MGLFTSYNTVEEVTPNILVSSPTMVANPYLFTTSTSNTTLNGLSNLFTTTQTNLTSSKNTTNSNTLTSQTFLKDQASLAGGDIKNTTLGEKLQKAADYATIHKRTKSTHLCAAYISKALSVSGVKFKRRNGWLYNLTANELGMLKVADLLGSAYKTDNKTYKKGDIAVTHKNHNSWGHVAICNKDGATLNDSTAWISDFASRATPYQNGVESVEVFRALRGGRFAVPYIRKGALGLTLYQSVNPTKSTLTNLNPSIYFPTLPNVAEMTTETPTTTSLSDLFTSIDTTNTATNTAPETTTTENTTTATSTTATSSGTTDTSAQLSSGSSWKISDAMFKNLLKIEGGLNMKASTLTLFGEKFVTGPYGMVYKHIDANGNLLSNPVRFALGETVTPQFAEANARAYYNKKTVEWLKILQGKSGVTLNKIDALVAASGGTAKSTKALQDYVVSHWNDQNAIASYIRTRATTAAGNKVMPGLVTRRKFESDWYLGGTTDYTTYQKQRRAQKALYGTTLINPYTIYAAFNPNALPTTIASNPYSITYNTLAAIPKTTTSITTLPTTTISSTTSTTAVPTTTTTKNTTTSSTVDNSFKADLNVVSKAVAASKLGYYMDPSFTKKRTLGNNSYKGQCTSGPATFYHAAGIKLNGHWWSKNGKSVTASAKPTGTNIDKAGFVKVGDATDVEARNNSVQVLPGDIGLLYADNGHVHAEMWNGENWVSDTVQRNGWCYGKTKGRMEIWRYAGKNNTNTNTLA